MSLRKGSGEIVDEIDQAARQMPYHDRLYSLGHKTEKAAANMFRTHALY